MISTMPLAEVLDFYNGKAPRRDVDGEYIVYGSNGTIGRSKEANHEIAIILGRVGAYCGSVELCLDKFWASDNTIVVKPKKGFDLRYLYYRLKSSPLRSYAGGAAQPLLTQTILRGVKLRLINCESKQKTVAEILSSYDDLIENNRRRIELLEQSARLLYKEWFVHLRFPGHEHVNITNGIPDGWEKKTIKEVASLNYGKALKKEIRIPGEFPVYGSSGIVGSHEKALVKGPAIIVGRKGNVGSIFRSTVDFHPIDTVYFIESDRYSAHLYYALIYTRFINTDVAVPGLNRDFAYSRELLIPSITILRLFEEQVEVLHNQIDNLVKYNESLASARDLLLPRLMNGEISV